jgi:hypothetical protein
MRSIAGRLAQIALMTLAIALACDVFIVTHLQFGNAVAVWSAAATLLCSALLWYGIGLPWRARRSSARRRARTSGRRCTCASIGC